MGSGPSLENPGRRRRAGIFFDKNKKVASPQIACRFDIDTFKELRRRADEMDQPVSFVIRELIADGLTR